MLDFPRWKVVSILLACAVFLLLALPVVLTPGQRAELPGWMPVRPVSLGLDLHGGSQWRLKADTGAYLHAQAGKLAERLRLRLRRENVAYTALAGRDGQVVFTLAQGQEHVDVAALIGGVDPGLAVLSEHNGTYTVGYGDAGARRLRDRAIGQAVEVIRRRVGETGEGGAVIRRSGDDHILLQMPEPANPELLKRLLGKRAKLTFHLLDADATQGDIARGQVGGGSVVLPSIEKDDLGRPIRFAVKRRVELSGEKLADAAPTRDEMGRPAVSFRFMPEGAKRFAAFTAAHAGQSFAMVLDDEVIAAPRIVKPASSNSGLITGRFTPVEADVLAVLLRSGPLPVPLEVVEERSVGPALGEDVVAGGVYAAVAAMLTVFACLFLGYGVFGLFAAVALLMQLAMIAAFLSLTQVTLTLPGIAGIVLALVMAVDAHVLVFERIREEAARGKAVFSAADNGFKIAYRSILDSHIVALIAALILFHFGTATIQGFAVMLSAGILASMFSAVELTRLMVGAWLRLRRYETLPI